MELFKKVFKIDLETCQKCNDGKMKIIAAVIRVDIIRKILIHLKIDPEPPKIDDSRYQQYEYEI